MGCRQGSSPRWAASLPVSTPHRMRTVVAAGLWGGGLAWTVSEARSAWAPPDRLGALGRRRPPPPASAPCPSAGRPLRRVRRAADERQRGTGWAPARAAARRRAAGGSRSRTGRLRVPSTRPSSARRPASRGTSRWRHRAPWPDRQAALGGSTAAACSRSGLAPAVLVQDRSGRISCGPRATWPFIRFHAARPPSGDGVVFDTVGAVGRASRLDPRSSWSSAGWAPVRDRAPAPPHVPARGAPMPPSCGRSCSAGPQGPLAPFTHRLHRPAATTPMRFRFARRGLRRRARQVVDAWADRHRERSWAVAGAAPALAGFAVAWAIGGVAVSLALTFGSYQRSPHSRRTRRLRGAGVPGAACRERCGRLAAVVRARVPGELPARAPGPALRRFEVVALGLYQGPVRRGLGFARSN